MTLLFNCLIILFRVINALSIEYTKRGGDGERLGGDGAYKMAMSLLLLSADLHHKSVRTHMSASKFRECISSMQFERQLEVEYIDEAYRQVRRAPLHDPLIGLHQRRFANCARFGQLSVRIATSGWHRRFCVADHLMLSVWRRSTDSQPIIQLNLTSIECFPQELRVSDGSLDVILRLSNTQYDSLEAWSLALSVSFQSLFE